ncbi:MAG: hypothetical protein ACLFP4_15830 [Spirochaetales bacterium]
MAIAARSCSAWLENSSAAAVRAEQKKAAPLLGVRLHSCELRSPIRRRPVAPRCRCSLRVRDRLAQILGRVEELATNVVRLNRHLQDFLVFDHVSWIEERGDFVEQVEQTPIQRIHLILTLVEVLSELVDVVRTHRIDLVSFDRVLVGHLEDPEVYKETLGINRARLCLLQCPETSIHDVVIHLDVSKVLLRITITNQRINHPVIRGFEELQVNRICVGVHADFFEIFREGKCGVYGAGTPDCQHLVQERKLQLVHVRFFPPFYFPSFHW